MIPSFATAGVLIAPPAALVLSGYVPGNPLAAQHYNYMWAHLTLELNNLVTMAGLVQDSSNDLQVYNSVNAVAQKALAIMNCVRVTTGNAMTVPIGSGTIVTSLGSGSTYTVTLPDAHSALVAGFEVDVQNHNAGATNMLGSGYGSVLVKLLNVNDGLAGFTNGTWQITEQYGHLRVRPSISGNPSGYGWVVESCDGTVYRNVATSNSTRSGSANTWYNDGGSLTLGPGVYDLGWSAQPGWNSGSPSTPTIAATLSTANNSESDVDFTASRYDNLTSAMVGTFVGLSRKKRVIVAVTTTFYLNERCTQAATVGFYAGAVVGNTIIEARRVA